MNWVNDRADSDVHVILTSESVGGGGQRYSLDFIGRSRMAHLADELTYTSSGTDVQIETMDGITQTLRIGLMRYAVEAGFSAFDLAYVGDVSFENGGDIEAGAGAEETVYDPWDYWTFRAGLSGNMDIRETRRNNRFNPSFSVDRVTEGWKFNLSADVDFRRQSRQLSSGNWVQDDRDDWGVNTLLVRSMTPRVSTGIDFGASNSVANNRRARITALPALEWNYFPYEVSNRRQMIVHYGAGVQYNNYEEETIYEVTNETLPMHRVGIQYRASEGWGNAGISLDASQYLHDSGLYSFGLSGNLSLRITRGLELSLSASGSMDEDQLHVPITELSDEDILLGRVNLPSSYRYWGSIGFNYRFGSSFTNIVNTRFPRSVR